MELPRVFYPVDNIFYIRFDSKLMRSAPPRGCINQSCFFNRKEIRSTGIRDYSRPRKNSEIIPFSLRKMPPILESPGQPLEVPSVLNLRAPSCGRIHDSALLTCLVLLWVQPTFRDHTRSPMERLRWGHLVMIQQTTLILVSLK